MVKKRKANFIKAFQKKRQIPSKEISFSKNSPTPKKSKNCRKCEFRKTITKEMQIQLNNHEKCKLLPENCNNNINFLPEWQKNANFCQNMAEECRISSKDHEKCNFCQRIIVKTLISSKDPKNPPKNFQQLICLKKKKNKNNIVQNHYGEPHEQIVRSFCCQTFEIKNKYFRMFFKEKEWRGF